MDNHTIVSPHQVVSLKELAAQSSTMRRQQNLMPIGPHQLHASLENITKNINIDSWKNIPQPVCQAQKDAFACIDYIKRFVLFMESRFNNLTLSVAQTDIDINNNFTKFEDRVIEQITNFEEKMQAKIEIVEKCLDESFILREKEHTIKLIQQIQDRADTQTSSIKVWASNAMNEKIKNSESKSGIELKRQIKLVDLKFDVPMFIGQKDCHYDSYPNFIRKQHQLMDTYGEKLVEHYEMIHHQQREQFDHETKVKNDFQKLLDGQEHMAKTMMMNKEENRLQVVSVREKMFNSMDFRIKELNFGLEQQVVLKDLTKNWEGIKDRISTIEASDNNEILNLYKKIQDDMDALKISLDTVIETKLDRDEFQAKMQSTISDYGSMSGNKKGAKPIRTKEIMATTGKSLVTSLFKKLSSQQTELLDKSHTDAGKNSTVHETETSINQNSRTDFIRSSIDPSNNGSQFEQQRAQKRSGKNRRANRDDSATGSSIDAQQDQQQRPDTTTVFQTNGRGRYDQNELHSQEVDGVMRHKYEQQMQNGHGIADFERQPGIQTNENDKPHFSNTRAHREDMPVEIAELHRRITKLERFFTKSAKKEDFQKPRSSLQQQISGHTRKLAHKYMTGNVTLSEALNGSYALTRQGRISPDQQDNPLKAFQIKPLQWDADSRNWINSQNAIPTVDSQTLLQTRMKEAQQQKPALIKDQRKYLQENDYLKRKNHSLPGGQSSGHQNLDEDGLFVNVKSLRQIPRYDFSNLNNPTSESQPHLLPEELQIQQFDLNYPIEDPTAFQNEVDDGHPKDVNTIREELLKKKLGRIRGYSSQGGRSTKKVRPQSSTKPYTITQPLLKISQHNLELPGQASMTVLNHQVAHKLFMPSAQQSPRAQTVLVE